MEEETHSNIYWATSRPTSLIAGLNSGQKRDHPKTFASWMLSLVVFWSFVISYSEDEKCCPLTSSREKTGNAHCVRSKRKIWNFRFQMNATHSTFIRRSKWWTCMNAWVHLTNASKSYETRAEIVPFIRLNALHLTTRHMHTAHEIWKNIPNCLFVQISVVAYEMRKRRSSITPWSTSS